MFLGIDAGGTKTDALLVSPTGAVLARGRFGPGNWESIGVDAAHTLYGSIINTMVSQAGADRSAISAVGWGLAGVDWPSDEARLAPGITALLPSARHTIVNDAFLPLRAGSTRPYGVAIIAGTGSTVAAIGMTGERARTYGLGADWGDFDGAQQLTRAAFRSAAQAEYGIIAGTLLTAALLRWSGFSSIPALAEAWSRAGAVPDLATFAPIVTELASMGDTAAERIIRDAATLLATNAVAMARAVTLQDCAFDVVLAGGVATGSSGIFRNTFDAQLCEACPRAETQILQRAPVSGAILLAMDAIGHDSTCIQTEW